MLTSPPTINSGVRTRKLEKTMITLKTNCLTCPTEVMMNDFNQGEIDPKIFTACMQFSVNLSGHDWHSSVPTDMT